MNAVSKVAFIGLGAMGFPMAAHLQRSGFDTTVYNRTTSKATEWVAQHGGSMASSPRKAAINSDYVFICVGADRDVRDVVNGPSGVLEGMRAGSVLIDHTTASADLARELGQICSEKSIGFLDAPVSGGQAGAENGNLTIMCGGDAAVFHSSRSALQSYSQQCTLIGPTGSGQLTKMVNQICIAGLIQGLSEGLEFGRRSGLDLELVLETISKGAAGSWQMENRARTMTKDEFDFGFAVDWMRKDLGIVFSEATRTGSPLPITKMVDELYKKVQQRQGNRLDTSSLISLLRDYD